ncbi:glycosyltransferase family 2 protein [Providencia stuartii]|uniref:glycosyltransferase family 2 protein n=1 Tax=Providencia stuartii TaxID=588 RepID=UPI0027FD2A6C|nr:glycosyltransferase [Providencia stuartii]MDQ5992055.1 glycosyltransferase [Providencia stuartii]
MTKISVIVPVYNAEEYIENSIISLMEQTLDETQFIIINDGSTDNSLQLINKIVENYPKRKQDTIIIDRKNKGVSSTRAEGLSLATGEYVIHFDSDDWAEHDMLELLYLEAKRYNSDIVICDYYINNGSNQTYINQSTEENNIQCIKNILSGKLHGASWNKLINRKLILENNINYIENIDYLEDVLFNIKALYFSKSITYINKAFYHYNLKNENSITSSINSKKIMHINESIKLIKLFLIENNLNEIANNELNIFKLNQKIWFIYSQEKSIDNDVLALYPEASSMIFKLSNGIHTKLILLSAAYNLKIVTKILLYIIKFFRRFL